MSKNIAPNDAGIEDEFKIDPSYEKMHQKSKTNFILNRHGGLQEYLIEKVKAENKTKEIIEVPIVRAKAPKGDLSLEGIIIDNEYKNSSLNLAKIGNSEVIIANEDYYNSESIAVGPKSASILVVGTMTFAGLSAVIGCGFLGPIGGAIAALSSTIISTYAITPSVMHDCVKFQYDIIKDKMLGKSDYKHIIENLSCKKLEKISDNGIKESYSKLKEFFNNKGFLSNDLSSDDLWTLELYSKKPDLKNHLNQDILLELESFINAHMPVDEHVIPNLGSTLDTVDLM